MAGVVPILDINGQPIENRSDKLLYLLKWMVFNPGWTSSWYDDMLMSMRKHMAEYAHDPNLLIPKLSAYLNSAIQHYYSDYSCVINRIDYPEDPNAYGLEIKVTDHSSGAFVFKGV